MKKKYSEMTPEEQWKNLHSKRNINAHIRMNFKKADKALRHARALAYSGDLTSRGEDILRGIETIRSQVADPGRLPICFQPVEWMLSQIVREASELITHASHLQEYLHGAREGNKTLVELIKERNAGNPWKEV